MVDWDGFDGAGRVGCVWEDYYTREVEAVRMRAGKRVGGS